MTIKTLELKNRVIGLKTATVPGKTADGAEIRVQIKFVKLAPTVRALMESEIARRHGLDLKTFSGFLDRVFFSQKNELCMTMLVKERVRLEHLEQVNVRYCYRTFNLDSGQVKTLRVLAPRRRPVAVA
jgi:hypothetical protein